MQRVVQTCCRLTSQVRNSFFLHYESSILTARAQSIVPQRLKHTDEAERADNEQSTSQFTGYIPVDELDFTYSKSSGPGGQHVNKVNTKVEVRFHVKNASWIPHDIKDKLMERERNRITKDGYLVLASDRTRKQLLNQADVMDRLRSIVFQAAAKPRGLTQDEIELKNERLSKARERTLREKRQHAMTKQGRGSM